MTTEESTSPSPQKQRSRFGIFLKWMLIVFAVMQLLMRTVWEPTWGDAIENLITLAQTILSVICIVIWWFFFTHFSRKTVLRVGLPALLVLFVWMGSIRAIDFDGDMKISFQYRWETTAAQRLAEYRQSSEAASTKQIEVAKQFVPEDMPAYRGINRDGVVFGPKLRTNWENNPPTELWRHPIGGGYSSFSVVDPVVITMEQRGEDEAVVCYDIETGQEFWEHRYPAKFNALGGPGPRSTPTIHNNAVYSFGCYGDLFCLDLKSGEPKWHVNVLQKFGLPTTHWGMTSSPLIHADNVIVNIGGLNNNGVSGNGLVAFKFETGELAWQGEGLPEPKHDDNYKNYKTGAAAIEGIEGKTLPGYSSPMLAELAGQQVVLNFDGTAFRGNDPESGKELWKFPYKAGDYINVAQPLLLSSDRVLISSGYGIGSAMLQISQEGTKWEVKSIWPEKNSMRLRCKFSSPLLHDGYIYGLDEGIMVCIDPKDGKRLWKGRRKGLRGRYGHGQILFADGHFIVLTEKGDLVMIQPSPEELKVVGIHKVLSADVKTWNPLTIAYGKAFVRNATEIACFDLRASPESSTDSVEQVTNIDVGSVD